MIQAVLCEPVNVQVFVIVTLSTLRTIQRFPFHLNAQCSDVLQVWWQCGLPRRKTYHLNAAKELRESKPATSRVESHICCVARGLGNLRPDIAADSAVSVAVN